MSSSEERIAKLMGATDNAPARAFSMAIVGDVRVEYRVRLADGIFQRMVYDHLEFAEVTHVVAGTAVNLARYGVRYFERTEVICRIGDDEFTPSIVAYFDELGVIANVRVTAGMRNGVVLVVRDANGDGPEGVRLLISGVPTPHALLSATDIDAARRAISTADVVFADAYGLLEPDSRAAIAEAQRCANSTDALFCLDLVPHDLDARLATSDLTPVIAASDVVIAGARTAERLLGRPAQYPSSLHRVKDLARDLSRVFGERLMWLVRFGAGDMTTAARCRGGEVEECYDTGYAAASETLNFGDRLAAAELFDLVRTARGRN